MPIDTDVDPKLSNLPQIDRATPPVPLLGIVTLAATFGVELMLTAFIAFGRVWQRPQRALFTARAWSMLYPERDLQIYIAGIAVTLLIVLVACWGWTRICFRTARRDQTSGGIPPDRADTARLCGTTAIPITLALAGLIAFLFLLSYRLSLDRFDRRPTLSLAAALPLCLPGLAAFALAAIDWCFQISTRLPKLLALAGPILIALSIRFQLLLAPPAMELEMLLLLALLFYWLPFPLSLVSRGEGRSEGRPPSTTLRRAAILAAMAAGTFAIYLTLLPATDPVQTGSLFDDPLGFRARIPVFAMVLCLALDLHWGSTPISKPSRRTWQRIIDIALPLLLFATLFIPPSRWMLLTGSFFQTDELHHWNYFTLGPALAFSHGRALITETYSQYGVAWPYLFALFHRLITLNYANIVGWSILYACFYFLALYLFLRLLLRDATWAACGAILAVTLQIFSGLGDNEIIWNFPSSTMLRHPLDVFLFIALLAHYRFGGRKWFALSGAICGLAVLFELDTGIDLILILAFYWLLDRLRTHRLNILQTRSALAGPIIAAISAAAIWLAGMALASRGTIIHATFWSGYVEGLHNQAFSGFGLLPIANVNGEGMAIFAGMLTLYFTAISLAIARIWSREASEIDLFLASISAYGLGLLLLFIGRSHPLNLFHTMIPLAIVIVLFLYNIRTTALADVPWTSFPAVFAVAALAMLWTKPEFAIYPSLAQSAFYGSSNEAQTLSLSPIDLGGLPLTQRPLVQNTHTLVNAIKRLPVKDQDILILDDRDTLLYDLTGRAPWSRFTSLFHLLITNNLIADTRHEILTRHPRYIVIRATPPANWDFTDTWTSFHRFLPHHYRLNKTIAGYEFWRLVH